MTASAGSGASPARDGDTATDWTAWQGDKAVSCPSIHPDVDEQCSLGNGHGEAHRVTIYWSDDA